MARSFQRCHHLAPGCLACQRGKIHHHTHLVPLHISIPQQRFSHLHVDLVGPLQYSNNFNYIFTIIDCTSKWMEAIPLSETSAAACALTFTSISCFGVPKTITSDHGLQFTSNLWLQLCKILNISHKQTTADHPESNGAVERLHRCLKDALCARAAATWSKELPFVLLDSDHSQGKTLVFPRLRPFLVHKLSCQIKILQSDELSLDTIVKFFSKTLHVFAPSLPRHNSTAQRAASRAALCPPCLGPEGWPGSTPSATLRRPLRGPAPQPLLLHHQSRVVG